MCVGLARGRKKKNGSLWLAAGAFRSCASCSAWEKRMEDASPSPVHVIPVAHEHNSKRKKERKEGRKIIGLVNKKKSLDNLPYSSPPRTLSSDPAS